ncbi:hypothetical protein HNP24_003723 [Chryseobacterium sediminis]|uniref:Uncharacterized protein n=1 Tax=Chryseobacterium sediminis TaxID=1679494 RepID=A0ABR6Q432_9FLAO|nr:hypothetical protein [Chryseobacterium sediminis]MBB6332720.1 hypothetical protein [Chryseobacterium sediminis]
MKRASIKDYGNLLKVFVILLDYGVIKKEKVISWADSILASENESEYVFIELSTCSYTRDIIQILNKNILDSDSEITSRAVLGILYSLLHEHKVVLKNIFETATHISYEEQLTTEEQFLLYRFDEYTELFENGIFEKLNLFKANFEELLGIYKDFKLDNSHQWVMINEKIKQDLQIKLEAFKGGYLY